MVRPALALAFLALLVGSNAAVCFKSRTSTGRSAAAATGFSIAQKGLMLWGCMVEGNPWLTYKLKPKIDPVYNLGTPTWVTLGYNFACMNNAAQSAVPDANLVGSAWNPGNAAFPPVWTASSVAVPDAKWSTLTGKGDGTGPSDQATSAWCGTAANCDGSSTGPGGNAYTGITGVGNSADPSTLSTSTCQLTISTAGIAGTYYVGKECAIEKPFQVPAADTPVCLMIVCGSVNTTVGCAFDVSLQVGSTYEDTLIASSASVARVGVAVFASIVAALAL